MTRRVEIYSTMLCPFCYQAKSLLKSKGVQYEEIDVMLCPGKRREMVERSGGRTSVPQIFVDGTHIGNCDEIYEMESKGELTGILEGSSAD
jgi:glutaredoxin 3